MTVTRRAPARPLIVALIAALAIAILPAATAKPVLAAGSVNLITSGATYVQNFESLALTGTSSTVPTGWDFAESGTNANTTYAAGTGSGTAGDTYSFGAATSTERAFGMLRSGSLASVIGAQFTNGAGTPLLSLGVSYTAEQWRLGQNTAGRTADRLEFQYSTDATSLSTGTWADVNGLDAASPVTAGTVGAIDGNAAGNRVTLGATISGLSIPTGQSLWIRWVDTDLTPGSDDGLGIDDVSITPEHAEGDGAPTVVSTVPADGATGVAANTPISITFSEPVTLDPGVATLSCTSATLSPTADPATFEFVYVPPLPDGGTCSYTIDGTKVHDTDPDDPPDTMTADVSVSFTVVLANPCAGAFTPIPTIQGVDDTADVTGTVTTEGVVVSDDEGAAPALRGFYLQDPAGDGNAATSDGIFVFNGNNNTVQNGDNVRVTGTASEFQGQTQISASSIVDCDTTDTVTPTNIEFPATSPTSLEAYEGMLVRVPEVLTVTEHFQLGRFGQVTLSSEGRLDNPTAVVDPGPDALALQAANNLRKIILDDSLQSQNPDPIRFGRGGDPLSASNTLRGGDTITNLTGVMTYTWAGNSASPNAYRIRPLNALGGGDVDFQPTNPRPGPTVDIEGENVRVAGLNLLNYFNTFDGSPDSADNCDFGVGGLPADCRGADTQTEFDRQWPKTVAAIIGLDADVIGINEIENDGYGADSAIAHLVGRLNAEAGAGTYAFIDVDAGTGQLNAAGTDAIKVGLVYRPAAVTPVGTTAALNSVEFVNGGDDFPRSRPSIAQAFETVDGARFIVDVNHFKSKGSACNAQAANDGQGNCNDVRTNAAIALRDWLAADPTGTGDSDILIVGDLNSYAMEDPITVLTDAGYVNLVEEFVHEGTPYSYVFDAQWGYLDYALGTASAVAQVAGVVEWHINSDEPSVLDYNTDFKSAGQIASLYAPDRFRVSDHDPIVVGLAANSDRPVVDAGGPYTVEEEGTTQLTATGSDPTGDDVTYAWDLDGNGSFETTGASVTFAAGNLQAPQRVTVTVQITDEHGQSSTDIADIDIIWDFGGFKPPINGSGETTIKAGGSQPVKFSLDGPQGSAILDGAPTFQREHCTTHAAIGGPIPASSNEPLSYDAATDTYKFTWKTQKAWAGWCGTFSVHLADGQSHEFDVRFKP